MAEPAEDCDETGESQECVNMLYLASKRGSNCNPRELLQNKRQSEPASSKQTADTVPTRPKGAVRVGDKQVIKAEPKPSVKVVKPESSSSSPELSTHMRRQRRSNTDNMGRRNRDSSTDSTESQQSESSKSPEAEPEQDRDEQDCQIQELQDNVVTKSKSKAGRVSREESGKSKAVEEKIVERICPRVNCPEKIVICLDISHEMTKVSFRSRAGDKFAPLGLVKRALGIFLRTKHKLNRKHEFALVMLQNSAIWMCDFTNDPNKIVTLLEDVQSTVQHLQTEFFDLSSVFEEVSQKVDMPVVENPAVMPPPYVVRVVLLYGRSNCLPTFSSRESEKLLQTSPHFFFDAFYIHEQPSEENEAEKTFEVLCDLDTKGLSYVFEVSRNPTKLYDCMAQLLPHPLQRPIQRDAFYSIETKPDSRVIQ